jgi:hypothetical protein
MNIINEKKMKRDRKKESRGHRTQNIKQGEKRG